MKTIKKLPKFNLISPWRSVLAVTLLFFDIIRLYYASKIRLVPI